MKTQFIFDTLAYASRLKAAGLEPRIAETHAEAKAEMLTSLIEDVLVTKPDLIDFARKSDFAHLATQQDLRHLESQVQHLESRFEHKFELIESQVQHLESRFEHKFELIDSQFEHVDTQFKLIHSQLSRMDSKFATKEDLSRIESRMERLGTELTLRLGGVIIASLAGMTAFISYFHLIH